MIGAGTVINPILKIVTTIAILAAVSIFVVKPILDTTKDISHDASRNARQASREAQKRSDATQLSVARTVAQSRANALLAGSQPWPAGAREVSGCIRAAKNNLGAMNKCGDLASRIQSVQSTRTSALSYIPSLQGQGKTSEAKKVQSCVSKAEFSPGAMAKCRDLASKSVFG